MPEGGSSRDRVIVGGEALEVERARVADVVERVEHGGPIGVVVADDTASLPHTCTCVRWSPASRIAAAGLFCSMFEVIAVEREPDAMAERRLECVERLFDGVDETRLVAVEGRRARQR
jgi:hypothetical protein